MRAAEQGGRASKSTQLDTGWRTIPVLVAEIPGRQAPEEFVLLHGHVDGWHVGVGDNSTGNATLLELARVFWRHRRRARTLAAHRVVVRAFPRPVRGVDVVRGHGGDRSRTTLRRPGELRLAGLPVGHDVQSSDRDE